VRMAFALQLGFRLAGNALNLIWIRLLVAAMGLELNSLYLAFQRLTSLGGLGDLGLGGSIAIRTGECLGQGKEAELKDFLASARTVFLVLALAAGGGLMALSPWLPGWLGYRAVPAAGTREFTTNDFINLESLSRRLTHPSDEVSKYVSGALSDETHGLLGAASAGRESELRSHLQTDFNRISRDTNFNLSARIAGVRISPETRALMASNPTGEQAVRVNRLLLMDAFPKELDRDRPSGPLPPLFAIGAVLVAGVVLFSYISNLNYACGNLTWPPAPMFILLQFTLLGQWLLARQGLPLWIQFLPAVLAAGMGMWLSWFYMRVARPDLSSLLPLAMDWRTMLKLFESSFWIYLCGLGNSIYRTTDSQVINAGFKPGTLPGYEYNYKFCELAVVLALTASFVSLPKITQWMSSAIPEERKRVKLEMRRLNQFQTLLGCGAALAYLGGNNLFMKLWFLHAAHPILPAPTALQIAFALNLAITTSGDAGIQLALRSGHAGLRSAGLAIGLTGLLNLGLSLVAMQRGSLWGIAMATVVAQSILSVVAGYLTCRHQGIPWLGWTFRSWVFPTAAIAGAGWLRTVLAADTAGNLMSLAGVYAALLLVGAWVLGVRAADLRKEAQIILQLIRR